MQHHAHHPRTPFFRSFLGMFPEKKKNSCVFHFPACPPDVENNRTLAKISQGGKGGGYSGCVLYGTSFIIHTPCMIRHTVMLRAHGARGKRRPGGVYSDRSRFLCCFFLGGGGVYTVNSIFSWPPGASVHSKRGVYSKDYGIIYIILVLRM